MFDVGFSEILFILIIAIVVLGPERLPEAGKYLGKILRTWRGAKNEFHLRLNDEIMKADAPKPAVNVTAETESRPAGETQ